jgi:DNA polymerase-3 subunit delta'
MSNILLKTLEEPPLHTVIILLANHPRLLLPTILSRCQTIRFNSLPIPLVSGWLVDKMGYQEDEAHLLASLSDGSPGKAMEIREGIREIPREGLLKDWIGLRKLSFEKMEFWTESLPSQRETLLLILEVAKTLLRDLVMVNLFNQKAKLIHTDLFQEMERVASQCSLSSLLKRMRALHQAILAIRGNANTALALEAMMFSWAEG